MSSKQIILTYSQQEALAPLFQQRENSDCLIIGRLDPDDTITLGLVPRLKCKEGQLAIDKIKKLLDQGES